MVCGCASLSISVVYLADARSASQVLIKGQMLDYYDVSGCYILRPGSYTVWQYIQSELRPPQRI